MKDLINGICQEIGLDMLEINQGWDFNGTLNHYTQLAEEMLQEENLTDEDLYNECYKMIKQAYQMALEEIKEY